MDVGEPAPATPIPRAAPPGAGAAGSCRPRVDTGVDIGESIPPTPAEPGTADNGGNVAEDGVLVGPRPPGPGGRGKGLLPPPGVVLDPEDVPEIPDVDDIRCLCVSCVGYPLVVVRPFTVPVGLLGGEPEPLGGETPAAPYPVHTLSNNTSRSSPPPAPGSIGGGGGGGIRGGGGGIVVADELEDEELYEDSPYGGVGEEFEDEFDEDEEALGCGSDRYPCCE